MVSCLLNPSKRSLQLPYFLEIVKSASESSISEASQHSNESSKSAEATAKPEPSGERRKSSISGAKSWHEMKSATVEGPGCSSEQKSSEGEEIEK